MGDDGVMPRRLAARVVLVSPAGRVLLFRYRAGAAGDPKVTGIGAFWVPPGGGAEPGETAAACAVRELREETGIALDEAALGEPVALREAALWIRGVRTWCEEWFFVVRVASEDVDRAGWTEDERGDVDRVEWFGAEALRGADGWDALLAPKGAGWFYAACAEGRGFEGLVALGDRG